MISRLHLLYRQLRKDISLEIFFSLNVICVRVMGTFPRKAFGTYVSIAVDVLIKSRPFTFNFPRR